MENTSQRALHGGADCYYTNRDLAERLALAVTARYGRRPLYVEPSAGDGAFLSALRDFRVRAYDLNPAHHAVTRSDWFSVKVPANCVVIGNPPFGFAASLAVRFFNHAATAAKAIAFIVPRSFQKGSVQRRLDPHFWLIHEEVLPFDSFVLNGQVYGVPCVFQIWERRTEARDSERPTVSNPFIRFVRRSAAHGAVRRVGGRAGEVLDGLDHSPSSTLWFVRLCPEAKAAMAAIQPALRQIRDQTAGVRSVSKTEIAACLNAYAAGRLA